MKIKAFWKSKRIQGFAMAALPHVLGLLDDYAGTSFLKNPNISELLKLVGLYGAGHGIYGSIVAKHKIGWKDNDTNKYNSNSI